MVSYFSKWCPDNRYYLGEAPEVKNLFMNGEILEVFRALIRTGTPTVLKTTPGLAGPERVLYEYLVTKNVRLEQEQIPVPAIAQALAALVKT